jgi:hypothetical protein
VPLGPHPDGKLLAALSVLDLKHVVVVDEDIDVHNAMDVEWAIARALGKLHVDEKLWQDSRGRLCVRCSAYAAKVPGKTKYRLAQCR